MTAIPTAPIDLKTESKAGSRTLERWFYPFAGVALLAAVVVGFRFFYFHGQSFPGRPIPPPIRGLIVAHGVAMSLWIVLSAVQPMLIGVRKHRWHMRLGIAAALLAPVIVALGVATAIMSARVTPPEVVLWSMNPAQFLTVPLGSILLFAGFVAVGIRMRRRPAVHRAAMLMGTVAAVSAATGRMNSLSNLYAGTVFERVFGAFFGILLFACVLVAVRSVVARRLERPLLVALGINTFGWWALTAAAHTHAWERFALVLMGR